MNDSVYLAFPLFRLWQRFEHENLILISEPYGFKQQKVRGDKVTLNTPKGPVDFLVAAIFTDYGSDQGMLIIRRDLYATLWNDPAVSVMGIYLSEEANTQKVLNEIRGKLNTLNRSLSIRSNKDIRQHTLDIFDRTFTITQVLRLLAIGIAFISILSTLMALQLEQAKQHAILRATGLTPNQLLGIVSLQTGLMGLMAGLFSLPLGWVMSEVLIQVINIRSFGWSMDSLVRPGILLEALSLALFAALLAGLYPAYRIANTRPAIALREE